MAGLEQLPPARRNVRARRVDPPRRPIAIQRWSFQRIALTLAVAFGALVLWGLLLANLQSGAL